MTSHHVLVVEDEQEIRELLQYSIGRSGYAVTVVPDAESALDQLKNEAPDLILIDWMLPRMNGIELARRIRHDQYTKDIPLIMLTARGEEVDKLKSFDAGVDDYVTKPFSPRELNARIRALLRRSGDAEGRQLLVGNLTLDTVAHSVCVNGSNVHLRPTEFRLLELFLRHPKRAFSRSQLLDLVWGRSVYVDKRTVDVHVLRLRKALHEYELDTLVQTVHGVGYRLNPTFGSA
ncbi:MAG: phosphate regulon transcriptional regulator PhoB [Gammaproteobacteria bacterium]|nr:phosphate regulon transcriptional regulator PhoB [Gammaproteobacteria bacterium]